MSAISFAFGSTGKHTTTHAQLRDVEKENGRLIAGTEERERELHTALVRGCQDAMLIAELRAENTAIKAANAELRRATIRAKAEQERLRQAVINARPRITETVQRLDRPYVSHVQIPYPVPTGRDLSGDDTQELPLIDQPGAWPVYRMRDQGVA